MTGTIQRGEAYYQSRFFLTGLETTNSLFRKKATPENRDHSIWELPDETAQPIVHLVQPGDDQIDNLILDFNDHPRR